MGTKVQKRNDHEGGDRVMKTRAWEFSTRLSHISRSRRPPHFSFVRAQCFICLGIPLPDSDPLFKHCNLLCSFCGSPATSNGQMRSPDFIRAIEAPWCCPSLFVGMCLPVKELLNRKGLECCSRCIQQPVLHIFDLMEHSLVARDLDTLNVAAFTALFMTSLSRRYNAIARVQKAESECPSTPPHPLFLSPSLMVE